MGSPAEAPAADDIYRGLTMFHELGERETTMKTNAEVGNGTSAQTQSTPPAGTLANQWLEEGTAFAASMSRTANGRDAAPEPVDAVVIGGGQAGLSVGYHLAQRGIPFVVLDAHPRIGDVWRERWDSLRLFSTARFDGLDGMPFAGPSHRFPTKDEMGDYLESYARRFELPVRTGTRVTRVSREGDRYVVVTDRETLQAKHVVVAMSSYQTPRVPNVARDLDPAIVQLHSLEYRRPSQLPDGDVLVVGAGNSGAEIAMDLVQQGRRVFLSGRIPGEVPFDVKKKWVRQTIMPVLFRIVFHRMLSVATPIGRKARPSFEAHGTPLIRTRARDLDAAGVRRVGRTVGARNGRPVLADGTVLDIAAVVWCTGFTLGASWLDVPVLDDAGEPIQDRGIARGEPGLYFVGQHFLYAVSSAMVHGVGRDARRVAETIAARRGAPVAA